MAQRGDQVEAARIDQNNADNGSKENRYVLMFFPCIKYSANHFSQNDVLQITVKYL